MTKKFPAAANHSLLTKNSSNNLKELSNGPLPFKTQNQYVNQYVYAPYSFIKISFGTDKGNLLKQP